MSEVQRFKFKVLSDDVATEDLFEHKTHQHSAETLQQVIESSDGNITIGLEGSWGAGKSTVINMFHQNLLNKNEPTLFFLFDAWAHEDEPLRRIFLESLIKTIDPKEQNEKLQELEKELSGRTKTVEVTAKKSASRLGKLLSVCAFAVPIGVAFFNKLNFDKLSFNSSDAIYWTFLVFFPLSFICLLSPLWVLLYWRKKGDLDPDSDSDNKKINWDFFKTESTEDYTQDISEKGERTSIEFQNYFKEILEVSFKSNNYTKAIIVIDNLDRVDADQAKSIWSTLQAFFQNRSLSSTDTPLKDKMWFIVPYDREGFSAIWDKDKKDEKISISFLDKCFQIRVEVPQPITSNWLSYCTRSINQALLDWSEDQKKELIDEYSRIVALEDITPTPRKMRAWINQVGMNGCKWQGKFSPKSTALYSFLLLQYSASELKDYLLKNDAKKLTFNNNPPLTYELAGLLFGVEKGKGAELLLKESIECTLDELQTDNLKNLAEEHKQVFWLAWMTNWDNFLKIYSPFESGKLNHFTNYICSEFGSDEEKILPYMQKLLIQWKTIKNDDWDLDKVPNYGDTLNTLISCLGKREDDINWLLDCTQNLCNHIVLNQYIIRNSGPLEELRKLIDTIQELGYNFPYIHFSYLDKDQWKKWLDLTNEYNIQFPNILPNKQSFLIWSAETLSSVNNIQPEELSLLIETIPYMNDKNYWDGVEEKLITLFSAYFHSRTRNIDELYELAFALLSNFNFSELETVLKSNGHLQQTIGQEVQKNHAKVYYLAALLFPEDIQKQTQFTRQDIKDYWKTSSEEKITETTKFFAKYDQLPLIAQVARSKENLLALEIIKKCDDEQLFDMNSNIALYVNEYNLHLQDSQQIKNIITNICSKGGFSDEVQTEYRNQPILYSECFCLFLEHGDQLTQSKIVTLISGINREDWEVDLNNDKKLCQLFSYPVIKLDYRFSEAFFAWLLQVVTTSDKDQELVWSKFDKIINYLLDQKDNFKKVCVEYFQQSEDLIEDTGFECLKVHWQDISIISPEKVSERLKIWLDKNQWNRIDWLLTKKPLKLGNKSEVLISRIETKLEEFQEGSKEKETLKKLYEIYN